MNHISALGLLSTAVILAVTGCGKESSTVTSGPRVVTTLVNGWKEVKTSGFAISFPGDWKSVDLSTGDLQKNIDRTFAGDPAFAGVGEQVMQAAKSGAFKLMVFAPANTPSHFRPNANVIVLEAPAPVPLEDIVAQNVAQLKTIVVPGETTQTTYVTTPAGRVAKLVSHERLPQIADVISTAFIAMKGTTVATITFATTPDDADSMAKTADASIATFRFE